MIVSTMNPVDRNLSDLDHDIPVGIVFYIEYGCVPASQARRSILGLDILCPVAPRTPLSLQGRDGGSMCSYTVVWSTYDVRGRKKDSAKRISIENMGEVSTRIFPESPYSDEFK